MFVSQTSIESQQRAAPLIQPGVLPGVPHPALHPAGHTRLLLIQEHMAPEEPPEEEVEEVEPEDVAQE